MRHVLTSVVAQVHVEEHEVIAKVDDDGETHVTVRQCDEAFSKLRIAPGRSDLGQVLSTCRAKNMLEEECVRIELLHCRITNDLRVVNHESHS